MYPYIVTFTGADDSVSPRECLSRFITLAENNGYTLEIGLLLGREYQGSNRFPSVKWLNDFVDAVESMGDDFYNTEVSISGHLCGDYVQEFLLGTNPVATELPRVWKLLNRVQLNTHGVVHSYDPTKLLYLLSNYLHKKFIFQIDNVNNHIFQLMVVKQTLYHICPLFDLSHGTGISPTSWPAACYDVKSHGYAGGIGPHNLTTVLDQISEVTGPYSQIWIDMETKVRSNNDKLFDMELVTAVVEELPKIASHGVVNEEFEEDDSTI